MNTFTVKFFDDKTQQWIDYTKKAVFPIKFADLLDEQLDEAELTLKNVPVEYFQPLTIVEYTVQCTTNAPITSAHFQNVLDRKQTIITASGYDNDTGKYYQRLTRKFVIANDSANEVMGLKVKRGVNVGKSVYNHQIYLIEITKIAEGFIGDAITYTNALGNDYVGG